MRFSSPSVRAPLDIGGGHTTLSALAGRWRIHEYVDSTLGSGTRRAIEANQLQPLVAAIDSVSDIARAWMNEGCYHEAYEILQGKVLSDVLSNSSSHGGLAFTRLIETLDRTDLYYNLGYIKCISREYDRALNWFAAADEENASRTGRAGGEILRGLTDAGQPLEYLDANIRANCSRFMPGVFGPYEYEGVFGRGMNRGEFLEILRDLKVPLYLQFLHTILTFWDKFSLPSGVVRFIRLSRLTGELCHVLDWYLAGQPACNGCGTLFPRLERVASLDPRVRAEFDEAHHRLVGHGMTVEEVNEQFRRLARLIEGVGPGPAKWAYCLVLTQRMRNVTAHDLNDAFLLNEQPVLAKKVFLAVLMSYFVCRRLLGA